jgi:hypothetical protein
MTLRDQGDPLSSQMHRSKRWTASFKNLHFTISEVYEQCPEVFHTVVYQIVTKHLQYRKICARWVPRMLTDAHKAVRMGTALMFMDCYEQGGNTFLARGNFLFTIRSKCVLYLTHPPRRHFLKGKVVDIWSWPFISMWVRGCGCMKVYLHFTGCLSDTVFIFVQGHLYFFYKFTIKQVFLDFMSFHTGLYSWP